MESSIADRPVAEVEDPSIQAQPDAAEPVLAEDKKPGRYVVLEEDSEGKWEMVKTVEAFGPQAAKRAVIEGNPSYMEAIELGHQITLVAVAERYWKPTTPRVTTTTSVNFD